MRRRLYAAAGALAAMALVAPPKTFAAVPLFAFGGWRASRLPELRARRAREELVAAALPDALDMLAVCVVGGMGIDPALRLVAQRTPGPCGEALRAAVAALDVGLPRDAAYETMKQVAGCADVDAFVRVMLRSERYGVPLSSALATAAAEARERRLARVRERALGAPVRMLFPLTLCFLPAFVLLAVAPSLIVALRSFAAR